MSELSEEILGYHRDEDYKLVRLNDDIISAVRYAFMMRRKGKSLDQCDEYGGRRVRSTSLHTCGGRRFAPCRKPWRGMWISIFSDTVMKNARVWRVRARSSVTKGIILPSGMTDAERR